MGSALVRGLIAQGRGPAIVAIDPHPRTETVAALAAAGGQVNPPANPAATLILAVKPQMMAAALATARGWCSTETLVISVAAGVSIATLAEGLPARRILRAMPNTPAAIGMGITGIHAPQGVDAAARAEAEALLRACGDVVWVDTEQQLDVVTAVSGSGPAYVFLLAEALAAAGTAQGLAPAVAERLARQTVAGAGALLAASSETPESLRNAVTSPGGTTAAALAYLTGAQGSGSLQALMAQAVAAATRRAAELGVKPPPRND